MSEPRVLIVDDEPAILAVLKLALASARWQIETAPSTEAALPMLRRAHFDLLLLDKNLPGKSGIELAVEARRLLPRARIVLMTGYSSSRAAIDALNAGVDDYIEKPFRDIFAVVAQLASLLARPRAAAVQRLEPGKQRLRVAVLSPLLHARRRMAADLDAQLDDVHLLSSLEELAAAGSFDALVVDGAAYGGSCVEILRAARAHKVVVIAQRLPVPLVKQLIQLGVTTFVDGAADSDGTSARARHAIDFFRSSTAMSR